MCVSFQLRVEISQRASEVHGESLRNFRLLRVYIQMPDDEAGGDESARLEKMNPKEKVAFYCGALAKKYKTQEPEKLAICLKTLRLYLTNAKEHPLDPKFLKIR